MNITAVIKILGMLADIWKRFTAFMTKKRIREEVNDEVREKGRRVIGEFDSTDGRKVSDDDPDLFI